MKKKPLPEARELSGIELAMIAINIEKYKEEIERLKRENEGLVIDRDYAISNITNGFLDEIKQLREALEKIMEAEAPIMEGWETCAYNIAREALGISENECFGDGDAHD